MKGLRVTKIVTKIKFEEFRGDLETKKMLPEKISHEVFENNSIFHVK